MPYVKSLRDVRVTTEGGHVANIPANIPTLVADPLVPAAQAAGCVTCDQFGKIVDVTGLAVIEDIKDDEIPFLPPEDRDDPEKRERVIKLAVVKCFKKNDREDFNSTGLPKVGAIQRMIGFTVAGVEIAAVVETLKDLDD